MDVSSEHLFGLSLTFASFHLLSRAQIKKKPKRQWYERPHLGPTRRSIFGQQNVLNLMKISDSKNFYKHLRFKPEHFDKLLKLVGPKITHYCVCSETINPSRRLAVTLRYLATGESQRSLALNYTLGESTVHYTLNETFSAIWTTLKPIVLPKVIANDLKKVSEGFWNRWNFPNCIGCCDGKHVRIKKPPNAGSEFYNYKGYHSVILLAVCDYRYRFTVVDVGAQGRQSDGGVFSNSKLGMLLRTGKFPMPYDRCLPSGPSLPHYLLGDEGFGLPTYMMTPFVLLCSEFRRGRRNIESTFGISVATWRIFLTSIDLNPVESIDNLTLAATCLHNFRMIENDAMKEDKYVCEKDFRGAARNGFNLDSVEPEFDSESFSSVKANVIRNELAKYFVSGGEVSWQYDKIK